MSVHDLYRDYIHADFGPDDDDGPIHCKECYAIIPDKPAGFVKVRDKILSWDEKNMCPLEWSWIDEPFWKCPECGEDQSLDEVMR